MKKALLAAAVLAVVGLPTFSEVGGCPRFDCRTDYLLSSASDVRSYGILIVAPDTGCQRVRYRVETDIAVFLGHTPALRPGEQAVVRLGRGFSPGKHHLVIAAEGCLALPGTLRRVTLAKASPDHGWRGTD